MKPCRTCSSHEDSTARDSIRRAEQVFLFFSNFVGFSASLFSFLQQGLKITLPRRSPHPSRHLPHKPRFAFPASSSSLEILIHSNNHNPRMIRTSIGIKDIKRLDHRPIGQLTIQNSIPPAPCNHAPRTLGRHHASVLLLSPHRTSR